MHPSLFFFFNDTATTEIYTLSLHDALPIYRRRAVGAAVGSVRRASPGRGREASFGSVCLLPRPDALAGHPDVSADLDRKSTRLNSSHANISYAVFCLKKKNKQNPLNYQKEI